MKSYKNWDIPVVYWGLVFSLVIFVYTQNSFIRPTDDPKELILYTSAFLFAIWFVFHKSATKTTPQGHFDLLELGVLAYLLYMGLHLLVISAPLNEGLIVFGRIFLLLFCIRLLSRLEPEKMIPLFKFLIILGAIVLLVVDPVTPLRNQAILPLGNTSYFSDFYLLLLPWTVYFAFKERWKPSMGGYLVLFFVFLYEIIIKARMAPFVAIFVTILFAVILIIFSGGEKKKKIVATISLGGVIVLAGLLVSQWLPWTPRFGHNTVSQLTRLVHQIGSGKLQNS